MSIKDTGNSMITVQDIASTQVPKASICVEITRLVKDIDLLIRAQCERLYMISIPSRGHWQVCLTFFTF